MRGRVARLGRSREPGAYGIGLFVLSANGCGWSTVGLPVPGVREDLVIASAKGVDESDQRERERARVGR